MIMYKSNIELVSSIKTFALVSITLLLLVSAVVLIESISSAVVVETINTSGVINKWKYLVHDLNNKVHDMWQNNRVIYL